MTSPLDLDTLHLDAGSHKDRQDAMCVMEAVAFVAGEKWSDHPQCASPVIGAFLRTWNDTLDDAGRQTLKQYIPRLVGSKGDQALEDRRAWIACDWLVRTYTPVWLRLAGLDAQADLLEGLPELEADTVPSIRPTIDAVRRDAAAAGDAAWAAAGAAAWDAAWAAARDDSRSPPGLRPPARRPHADGGRLMPVTYRPADAVARIAKRLIGAHHTDLVDARIVFVFRSETAKKNGQLVFGSARKVSGLNAYLAQEIEPDEQPAEEDLDFFVIEISEPVWRVLEDPQRIALVDHELCHLACEIEYRDGDEVLALKMRGHDLEEFRQVVERHGLWRPEVEEFAAVIDGIERAS